MTHFIVLWYTIFITTSTTALPNPYNLSSGACYDNCLAKEVLNTKEFNTKKEAEKFIKDAPENIKSKMVIAEVELP
jgi:hypothetical protein